MEEQLATYEQQMEDLRNQRDAIVEKLKEVTRLRDQAQGQVDAQKLLTNMSPQQVAAVKQILTADGIASTSTATEPRVS